MPRLSRDVVAAREKLAREMLAAGKSSDDVQKALQAGWNGMKMAPGRLAELVSEAKGSPSPTVTLVNPLSREEPSAVDTAGTVDSSENTLENWSKVILPTPAVIEGTVVSVAEDKTYNPVEDGFLDFCRARAKANGHLIVDVSEELYAEWLETLKVQE